MPVRRKYKRRTYRRKKRSAGFTPRQRSTIKQIVKGHGEPKHFLYNTTTAVTSSWYHYDISQITQGDTIVSRDGDRAEPSSVDVRVNLLRDPTTTAQSIDQVRLLLLVWHPDSAVEEPSAAAKLFEDTTQTRVGISPIIVDKNNRSKFTLLYDKTHSLFRREDSLDSGKWYKQIRIFKKLTRPLLYNAGATTGKNHIYLVALGSQSSAAEDSTLQYESVVRFRDV